MKPIKFREQNTTFAENQDPYLPLPAHLVNEPEGRVISCWELSIFERIRILITGKLWISLYSFNRPLTPSYLTTKKSDLFTKNDHKHAKKERNDTKNTRLEHFNDQRRSRII